MLTRHCTLVLTEHFPLVLICYCTLVLTRHCTLVLGGTLNTGADRTLHNGVGQLNVVLTGHCTTGGGRYTHTSPHLVLSKHSALPYKVLKRKPGFLVSVGT
jgi:hypothetical protein